MLTEAQLAIRRGRITASIAADILGVGRFGSELTAWLEITGQPREDISSNPRVRAGHYFEDGVCRWWLDEVGKPKGLSLAPADTMIHPTHDWLAATPDRFVVDASGEIVAILQAKTSDLWNREAWEDLDTHDVTVPDSVRVQCAVELAVTGLPLVYVAAVVGGNRPYFAEIQRDDALEREIVSALRLWYGRHVIDKVQPAPSGRDCDTRAFRYLHPSDTGHVVTLSEETAKAARESLRLAEQIDAIGVERDRLRNLVRAEMETATIGEAEGVRAVYKTSRKGVRSLRIEST